MFDVGNLYAVVFQSGRIQFLCEGKTGKKGIAGFFSSARFSHFTQTPHQKLVKSLEIGETRYFSPKPLRREREREKTYNPSSTPRTQKFPTQPYHHPPPAFPLPPPQLTFPPILTPKKQNIYYGTLYAYTPEVLPSAHRGTGNGIAIACNRIMGIMSALVGFYTKKNGATTTIPIWVCAALFAVMALVSAVFPFEPRGRRSS
jgi:hypothetical protein